MNEYIKNHEEKIRSIISSLTLELDKGFGIDCLCQPTEKEWQELRDYTRALSFKFNRGIILELIEEYERILKLIK